MSLKTEDLVGFIKKHPVSVACGFISVGLLFAAFYRSELIDTQQMEVERVTANALRLKTNLTNAEKLGDHLSAITGVNEAVANRSIRPDELANNIQYFYRLEAESGVKYTDVRPVGQSAAGKTGKSYVAVNYSLALRGTYPQLLAFLRLLERGANFSRITGFVMTSVATDAPQGEISLSMTVDLLGKP